MSAVIAGVGVTDVGKVYGRSATDFAADAVRRAALDAGVGLGDVDGLLISSGLNATSASRWPRRWDCATCRCSPS